MPWTPIIAGPLPAVAAVVAGPQPEAPAVEAVLLRSEGVDPAALLDALQLRSPQRALAIPPWPAEPAERFGLFAVATVRHEGGTLEVTVVLSDGRAYYRTLESTADGAPRVAASTVAKTRIEVSRLARLETGSTRKSPTGQGPGYWARLSGRIKLPISSELVRGPWFGEKS